jgi:hypothetical protein
VKSLSDKLEGAPTLGIKWWEQEAWDRLILKLQVQDSFTLDEFKKIITKGSILGTSVAMLQT